MVVDEEDAATNISENSSLAGTGPWSRGGSSSMGSHGSRRSTGRGSVGFALAPLEEVESLRVEMVSWRNGLCSVRVLVLLLCWILFSEVSVSHTRGHDVAQGLGLT